MLRVVFTFVLLSAASTFADDGTVIFTDNFDRTEADDSKEQPGNGWTTNSKSRAKGVKQVDLKDGAMFIKRAEVADHGVSVVQDLKFKDAVLQMKFRIGPKDDLGLNIADMQEKSVHAGHLCVARVRAGKVQLADLKTGMMKLEHRTARKAKTLTPELRKLINKKSKYIDHKTSPNEWHTLKLTIQDETMKLQIDGKPVGSFTSAGIGHPTKRRLRLSVGREAWVDDIQITRLK